MVFFWSPNSGMLGVGALGRARTSDQDDQGPSGVSSWSDTWGKAWVSKHWQEESSEQPAATRLGSNW